MKKRQLIIVIAFCVSFISMVALSLFSMQRFTTFTEYSDRVDHTNSVIKKILRTEMSLRDIDRAERGYMLTRDTMYLRFLNNAVDSIHSLLGQLKAITSDNTEQQNDMALVQSSAAIRIAATRQNVIYVDTSQSSVPSRYYYDSRQMMLDFSQRLNALFRSEDKLLRDRFKHQQFYQQLTTKTLIYLLLIFCLVTLILFFIMIKELRGRMRYQQELQAKVIDLKRSHDELKEIAYAASHDLQEPLRKMQVFSNMLSYRKEPENSQNIKTLERINSSAGKMQGLITDLMNLTSLIKIDEDRKPVDLNRVLQFILVDLEDKIGEKNADVVVNSLPILDGYENQLKILFRALLDNALKFTRDAVRPSVSISGEIVSSRELAGINPRIPNRKFYRITCSDNGIGFDNKFIAKMFRIFQRLHNEESAYEGKGIGLAICQRIMANHEGYIVAYGKVGEGADFHLYFPIES